MPQPQPIGVEPAEPTDVVIPGDQLAALLAAPILNLQAIQPWDLPTGTVANGWNQASIFDDGRSGVRDAMPSVFLGAAILFIAGWWLASGRAGAGLQPLAVPLAVATAVPFILRPLEATWSPPLVAIGGVLLALAMVPLAIGLHDRIADAQERRLVAQAVGACVIGAIVVGVGLAFADHPVVGEGTAALLRTQPDLAVVGVAGSLEAARDAGLTDATAVDVLLLDIRLGTDSGLRLLSDVGRRARRHSRRSSF